MLKAKLETQAAGLLKLQIKDLLSNTSIFVIIIKGAVNQIVTALL
jgi:hypothetical protein